MMVSSLLTRTWGESRTAPVSQSLNRSFASPMFNFPAFPSTSTRCTCRRRSRVSFQHGSRGQNGAPQLHLNPVVEDALLELNSLLLVT